MYWWQNRFRLGREFRAFRRSVLKSGKSVKAGWFDQYEAGRAIVAELVKGGESGSDPMIDWSLTRELSRNLADAVQRVWVESKIDELLAGHNLE